MQPRWALAAITLFSAVEVLCVSANVFPLRFQRTTSSSPSSYGNINDSTIHSLVRALYCTTETEREREREQSNVYKRVSFHILMQQREKFRQLYQENVPILGPFKELA
jgi:hypothetical protein